MKIWGLTQLGKKIARNTRNPDTPQYRIIHTLDRIGTATTDQIASSIGLGEGETGMYLSRLAMGKYPLVGML